MGHAMIPAKLAGAIILGVPLIVLAWAALWRRQRSVFWFAVALILVALGYLTATGATDDIARSIMPAPALQPAG
jgi:dipeptide/tripeptide permease